MGCASPKPDRSASHVLAFVPKDGRDATGVDCARNYRGLVLSSSFHGFVFHPESRIGKDLVSSPCDVRIALFAIRVLSVMITQSTGHHGFVDTEFR